MTENFAAPGWMSPYNRVTRMAFNADLHAAVEAEVAVVAAIGEKAYADLRFGGLLEPIFLTQIYPLLPPMPCNRGHSGR
jgi:hypothetical protein